MNGTPSQQPWPGVSAAAAEVFWKAKTTDVSIRCPDLLVFASNSTPNNNTFSSYSKIQMTEVLHLKLEVRNESNFYKILAWINNGSFIKIFCLSLS